MGSLWQEKSQIFPFRRRVPEPEVHPLDLTRASGAGQRVPRTRFGLVQSGGGAARSEWRSLVVRRGLVAWRAAARRRRPEWTRAPRSGGGPGRARPSGEVRQSGGGARVKQRRGKAVGGVHWQSPVSNTRGGRRERGRDRRDSMRVARARGRNLRRTLRRTEDRAPDIFEGVMVKNCSKTSERRQTTGQRVFLRKQRQVP